MPEMEVEARRRFEKLALPHLKSLYRFASRLTGNGAAAEDLVPMGTVMSRLHRGRKILERELWGYAKQRGLVKTWKRPSD